VVSSSKERTTSKAKVLHIPAPAENHRVSVFLAPISDMVLHFHESFPDGIQAQAKVSDSLSYYQFAFVALEPV